VPQSLRSWPYISGPFRRFQLTAMLWPCGVVLMITFFSLVIGELVPKRIALNSPERIASYAAAPWLPSPASSSAVSCLSFARSRPAGAGDQDYDKPAVTEEEIRILIDQGTTAGVIEEEEQDIRRGSSPGRQEGELIRPPGEDRVLDIDRHRSRDPAQDLRGPYSPMSSGLQQEAGQFPGVVESRTCLSCNLAEREVT